MSRESKFILSMMFLAISIVICLFSYSNSKKLKEDKVMESELKVVFLGSRPQYVSTLAEWTYNKWKNYDPTLTLEETIEKYQNRLNTNQVPFALVLLDRDTPIGMVYLDQTKQIEGFSDKLPWVGDFYILPKYDSQGIKFRRYLMRNLEGVCRNLRILRLYVYTSDPSRVDWYTELGWKIIKTSNHLDHLVTIMEYTVN